ncbi:MAG: C39 family peptidase [Patescibacteria group bacterium]
MAIRYVKQRDEYSCGPIAILNAMKWLGKPVTYKDLARLKDICCCRSPNGTWPKVISVVLKILKIKYLYKAKPSIKEIDKHLDDGGSILLVHYYNITRGHYVLCIGKTEKYYTLINDGMNNTITRCHKNTMKKMLHTKHKTLRQYGPCCWFIFKE